MFSKASFYQTKEITQAEDRYALPETRCAGGITIAHLRHTPHLFTDNAAIDTISNHELIFVMKGAAVLRYNLKEYPINSGSLYWLFPGCSRQLKELVSDEAYYISFSDDYCAKAYLSGLFLQLGVQGMSKTEPIVSLADSSGWDELRFIIKSMQQELANERHFSNEIVRALFQAFLTYVCRGFDKQAAAAGQNKEMLLSTQFSHLLQTHIRQNKQVTDYASMLYVTPAHLNKIVKKATGKTASYHIRQYILMEAKRRALYTNHSMKEIAFQLGFLDAYHFSKFFKKNSGANFSSFRNDQRNSAP